ncbi:MAG TPA: phenylalanine--tRNA ligase subunit alpha [Gammaproteobacteria bacterium]|jgi:phenylalanyl-tRNA synthetase alpha chain|nr:phenylalanine--tRNA ligase subunit alpha [Gammaproteobacteria bacterium]
MEALEDILKQAEARIRQATDLASLEACRVHIFGKKGLLTEHFKSLGKLSAEERPLAGEKINVVKVTIEQWLQQKNHAFKNDLVNEKLQAEVIDVTLPGRVFGAGTLHPITQSINALKKIFSQMGFTFKEGPEIEDDYHNFTALNIPPLHPARAMQDTFYFADDLLLRTHTSNVQIRGMKTFAPPFRMVAMGRVYRRDFDMTHTPMFHQLEALVVGEHISFADLKGMMTAFLHAFFSPDRAIRFRPSYFPFTEPSAEVDISCLQCAGNGCRICKQTGWVEVLGCGMVHPNVLTLAGIDSKRFRGFACGAGIDRLTLLKYGISDLRALFENDLRFLQQYTSN